MLNIDAYKNDHLFHFLLAGLGGIASARGERCDYCVRYAMMRMRDITLAGRLLTVLPSLASAPQELL